MSRWSNTPIEMQFRTIDGLTIRFAESEDRDDHALLLSPWPESLLAFEQMWARLAEHTHLVAIDLPGFGHSQRRDALLSPRGMGEFVVRAADSFGLEHPHVIGPDVGTGASLFAAYLYPGRLRSLVVGSGGAAFPLQLGGLVKEWVEAPDLDGYRNGDPRQIVARALTGIERYALPDFVREDYLSSYEGDRFVESMRYVRSYPTELPLLRDLLPEIGTPVQIIAGARDPAVPPVNAEFLQKRLPKSQLDIVDAGHFTWEDAADEYAALVTSWWSGGYGEMRARGYQFNSKSSSTKEAIMASKTAVRSNTEIIREYTQRVFNEHNPDLASEYLTPDVKWHGGLLGTIEGLENVTDLLRGFIGALPDLHAAEQDVVAADDSVVVRYVIEATHTGNLLGLEPTGRRVRWDAVDVYHLADGMIVEEWAGDDLAEILYQVGAYTPPWLSGRQAETGHGES